MRNTLLAVSCLTIAAIAACSSSPLSPGGDGGAAGTTGSAGATGVAGNAGAAGTTGVGGTTGAGGTTGVGGTTGAAGAAGTTGVGGTTGTAGAAGTTGVGGTTGTGGRTGSAGATGTGGSTGTAGTAGSPAQNPDGTCVPNAYHRPKPTDACACQETTPDVCPVVGCIDKKTDEDNCGACGMKCGPTSTCTNGACGPAPTVVTTIAGCSGLNLALNGTTVFVADEQAGTISKVNATGTPTAIITGEKLPTWLASNGANLFWYDRTTKAIRKAPAAGGVASDVYVNTMTAGAAGPAPSVGGFVVTPDGATIYISLGNNVYSLSVATPAAAPTLIATEDHGQPGALALNGTKNIVYPVASTVDVDAPLLAANPLPAKCGLEDATGDVIMTTCPRLGRSQGELLMTFMAVINGRAFWISQTDVRSEIIGAQGTGYEAVAYADNGITAATITTDTVYFGSFDPQTEKSGMIQKAPAAPNTTNAAPTSMARGLAQPTSMVVDATKVYWTASDCTISTLPK
jgi:hypothetical protein